jgi:hypothetical protein
MTQALYAHMNNKKLKLKKREKRNTNRDRKGMAKAALCNISPTQTVFTKFSEGSEAAVQYITDLEIYSTYPILIPIFLKNL